MASNSVLLLFFLRLPLLSKTLSSLPTANHITSLGEGLISAQWKASEMLQCVRCGENKFQVRRTKPPEITNGQLHPKFWRTRTVTISQQQLHCSCFHFERIGIGCRNILKVFRVTTGDQYIGFTHHDVSVTWWTSYAHFG